jgi:hypothetical protein
MLGAVAAMVLAPLVLAIAGSRAQSHESAAASAAALIARIEAPQVPDRQGFDALTLAEVMQRVRVPGLSVAVVKEAPRPPRASRRRRSASR